MSTTHTIHGDIGEAGLADGCDRCSEHAEHPFRDLDDDNLRDLLQRVVDEEDWRSENERTAMENITRALEEAASVVELNPILFSKYMMRTRHLHLAAIVRDP